jgi:hypothetical protein
MIEGLVESLVGFVGELVGAVWEWVTRKLPR